MFDTREVYGCLIRELPLVALDYISSSSLGGISFNVISELGAGWGLGIGGCVAAAGGGVTKGRAGMKPDIRALLEFIFDFMFGNHISNNITTSLISRSLPPTCVISPACRVTFICVNV